ncbi:iron chaperone [Enterococcus sp. DIV0756]|uniref:iron chaperone n=1 Tax=Enterococcus sp. DIV0756 TaxID=2774636 RepID=UPI003F2565DC
MSPIEEYIHDAEKAQQPMLKEIYQLIKEMVPAEATEKISYGMPTFYLTENLVHFGAMKKHLGFYPTPSAMTAFEEQLKDYKTSKGALQIPYTEELPRELITEMVRFRLKEVVEKNA